MFGKKAADIIQGVFDGIWIRKRLTECAMQAAQSFETCRIVERVEQIAERGTMSTQVSLGGRDRIIASLADIFVAGVEHVFLPFMHEWY